MDTILYGSYWCKRMENVKIIRIISWKYKNVLSWRSNMLSDLWKTIIERKYCWNLFKKHTAKEEFSLYNTGYLLQKHRKMLLWPIKTSFQREFQYFGFVLFFEMNRPLYDYEFSLPRSKWIKQFNMPQFIQGNGFRTIFTQGPTTN